MGPQNLRLIGDRIEQLLDDLRAAADPRTYRQAEELLRLVTELYGGGLERIVEIVHADDPAVFERLVADDLVASLLLVHGLHPDSMEVRVERALTKVRPILATHGGDVELVDIDAVAGAVRLRLLGSCDGCPSSAVTLRNAVEHAILEAAPEVVWIDVDEPMAPPPPPPVTVPVTLTVKPAFERCPTEIGAA